VDPVVQRKRGLRAQILSKREALSEKTLRRQSDRVIARLQTLPQFAAAKTVHCYVSWRHEVATHDFIRNMLDQGKRVVVPVVNLPERTLLHASIASFDELLPGAYGILEPRPAARRLVEVEKLDLVCVPGVAFDLRGHRLGYGGGFYDAFLAQTAAVKIGLAFDFQVLEAIPTRDADEQVDLIVSEKQVYPTSGR